MPKTLMIAWPTATVGLSALTTQALVDCARHPLLGASIVHMTGWMSGPLIAQARTGIVRHFLADTTAEWLLQVDTDMVFNPDQVRHLLDAASRRRVPILGALYAGTGAVVDGLTPVRVEAGWFRPNGYRHLDPHSARGVTEVDFIGAGMLLVHRDVFEALDDGTCQPWFQEVDHDGRVDGDAAIRDMEAYVARKASRARKWAHDRRVTGQRTGARGA